MKNKKLPLKRGTFALFAAYIIISLLLGEVHPFTQVPMYNNFPNWAYVFYVKNTEGNAVYINRYFPLSRSSGAMSHVFASYCQQKGYRYGSGEENKAELHDAGNAVLDFLLDAPHSPIPASDTLFLVRRHLFFDNNSTMQKSDEIIAYRAL